MYPDLGDQEQLRGRQSDGRGAQAGLPVSVWQCGSGGAWGWLGDCSKAPAVGRKQRGVVEPRVKESSSDRVTNWFRVKFLDT